MLRRHWIDRLYIKLSPVGSFFVDGWGDEGVIEHVVEVLRTPPPARAVEVQWGPERTTRWGREREGVFKSPVDDGTLPEESRTGRVQLLLPPRAPAPTPLCVHLAATGEQGFERRRRLCLPLLGQGVGALLLENPLYGQRRPARQQGSDVRTVAQIMTMGRAIVEEARALSLWAQAEGYTVGLSGYSMGGQMAAMAAALLPFPVAVVAASAPCTARQAFVEGLLSRVTCWSALAGVIGVEAAQQRLSEVLDATCLTRQPRPLIPEAAIFLLARDDGYIFAEGARRVHDHWPGSELRWMSGGHVSGYVASIPAMRAAIVDAFGRLREHAERR